MAGITIEYKGGLRCECIHEDSGVKLITDAPKDNHGLGEAFSPTDLMVVSTVTCMATLMGIQANFLKIDITGMKMSVEKVMSTTAPRRIAEMKIHFEIPQNFDDKTKDRLIQAANNCPVFHSLHPDVKKDVVFNWGVQG